MVPSRRCRQSSNGSRSPCNCSVLVAPAALLSAIQIRFIPHAGAAALFPGATPPWQRKAYFFSIPLHSEYCCLSLDSLSLPPRGRGADKGQGPARVGSYPGGFYEHCWLAVCGTSASPTGQRGCSFCPRTE